MKEPTLNGTPFSALTPHELRRVVANENMIGTNIDFPGAPEIARRIAANLLREKEQGQ